MGENNSLGRWEKRGWEMVGGVLCTMAKVHRGTERVELDVV